MINPELIANIQRNRVFNEIAEPLHESLDMSDIKDAEFLLRRDGIIFNIEGCAHPTSFVVGEVLYAPDPTSNKIVWGNPYRKVTLVKGTYDPIPYSQRAQILGEIDPTLNQNGSNPYFAKYKQILPASDFIAHLPATKALQVALSKNGEGSEEFHRDLENLLMLLALKPEEITLGLTGALLLGNTEHFHDLDIVFSSSPTKNLEIAKTMRDLALHEPERRLFEGGKGWQIRFFNDFGSLMCTFFTYRDTKDAPLNNFSMKVLETDVEITGAVSNDTHTMYTPTIIEVSDAEVKNSHLLTGKQDTIPIVVYHTASRGDCFNEDIISARGALVEINQQGSDPYPAVCVVERDGVANLTPPWQPYYE